LGGVAVELVHLASLYHDDVIDEATVRRNVESVNSRFGNLVAIVAGDYSWRARLPSQRARHEIADCSPPLGRAVPGAGGEVRSAFQTSRTKEDYFSAIAGKTAALMACSCRIGALTAACRAPRSMLHDLRAVPGHGLPAA